MSTHQKITSKANPKIAGGNTFSRPGVARSTFFQPGNQHIQRSPGDAPNAQVGGDSRAITSLSDDAGGTVRSGQAGFSRRVLENTGDRSQDSFNRLYADSVHRNVVINNAQIEADKRTRAREKQRAVEDSHDFMHIPSTLAAVQRTITECQQSMDSLDQQKREEDQKTFSYNAWVPSANGFYSSMARIEAMSDMLGISDPTRMVSAVTQGLNEARMLGIHAQQEHDRGRGTSLPVPPVDNTVVDASRETTNAAREMNVAYLGFQQNLMSLEISQTNAEGAADRARLARINEVKSFVKNVGRTMDVTVSVVSAAPAMISNATTTIQQTGASINAARNRSQIMAGQTPTRNPTFLTVNEGGEMVVRNMQTEMDTTGQRGADGRMIQTASPQSSGISLPSNISDLLGTITDFAYSAEVERINSNLEQIKSRCDTIEHSQELLRTRERAENFQSKINIFAQKCRQLQLRISQRRQAYLEFGVELDNFARTNAAARASGQAPGQNQERFATIMMITSQVREALAVGHAAKRGIDAPDSFRAWAQGMVETRAIIPFAGSYNTPTSYISIGDAEWNSISAMWEEINRFNTNINNVESVLQPIETAGASALSGLHQGGGGAREY